MSGDFFCFLYLIALWFWGGLLLELWKIRFLFIIPITMKVLTKQICRSLVSRTSYFHLCLDLPNPPYLEVFSRTPQLQPFWDNNFVWPKTREEKEQSGHRSSCRFIRKMKAKDQSKFTEREKALLKNMKQIKPNTRRRD